MCMIKSLFEGLNTFVLSIVKYIGKFFVNWYRKVVKNLRRFTRRKIAIDLGTANTSIYCAGEGIILDEPSVVAVVEVDGELVVVAVGNNAKKMIGRSSEKNQKMQVVRPVKDGVISDFELVRMMLDGFLKIALEGSIDFLPKKVMIGTPSGATSVERRAIKESVEGQVELIYEPLAAAIGADLPVGNPSGHMIIDIGGGTTEMAIISLGGIVTCNSVKVAGDAFDEAIINAIRKTHHVLIGYIAAENIKKTLGSALNPHPSNETLEVKGRDLLTGMPKSIVIDSQTVSKALATSCMKIVEEIKIILSSVDPTISSDIMQNGMIVTGGGALLKNLETFLTKELGIKVTIAKDPLYAVVRGLGKILENKNVTDITYN